MRLRSLYPLTLAGLVVFAATAAASTRTTSFSNYHAAVVSAGGTHTCAVTTTGRAKCWGGNGNDQLGNGVDGDGNDGDFQEEVPVAVSGLRNGVSTIAASTDGGRTDPAHTCAVTASGGVKCWGRGDTGQLGDGSTKTRARPVDVMGLTQGVTALALGFQHTCALTTAGGVECWGDNRFGQLGDGGVSGEESHVPVDVTGLTSGVSAITAGALSTCALRDGDVYCWGANEGGQLGNGTTTPSSVPTEVSGLDGVRAIDAGAGHACAVTAEHGLKCWGANFEGELGDGTKVTRLTPVSVSGLSSGVSSVSAGSEHTCAVTDAGGAKCWGDGAYGVLGVGLPWPRLRPADVQGLSSGVQAVSAGGAHTCALLTSGKLKCWGENDFGELGGGTNGLFPAWSEHPLPVIFFGASRPCIVPRVVGKRLGAAKRRLKRVACTSHVLRRHYSRRVPKGRVIRQDTPPRTVLPHRAWVGLVVSKGKRP